MNEKMEVQLLSYLIRQEIVGHYFHCPMKDRLVRKWVRILYGVICMHGVAGYKSGLKWDLVFLLMPLL